ncbi:MAG: uroporphyrinogen decarboxylase family protein, partial [Anaerolineales bacterium]|nr:uroporphyrinogen decarboxylase family protein [Anaerolineales bacterium]
MNGRERLTAVFNGQIPDKVPHMELVFQLEEEAFQRSWPSHEEMAAAAPKEREQLLNRFFDIWELIIETYDWAGIQLPTNLHGYYEGEVIPRGRKRFGERVMIYDWNGQGIFWMQPGTEMMEFAVKVFERPQELHAEARQKCIDSIALAKRQVEQGVDFICINSDYGYNRGPFISPKMFAEFVTPYLTEIVTAIHKLGVKAILHSDGDLRLILEQLVSTGLDGYQSIDPQGFMDIAEVKRQYGHHLILMGNVQTSLLQEVDDLPIRQSVRYAMKHGKPGGRYIFSTSNCIFKGMPLESYHIMLDEYEKLA